MNAWLAMIPALALTGLASAWMSTSAPVQRLVPAEIRHNGVTVLKGSTSDDGSADIDAVWDYQRARLTYVPEPGFASLGVAEGATTFKVVSAPRPVERGAQRPKQVVLDVSYGGEVATHELRLVRVPGSADPGVWRVADEELERLFPHRTLTRRQAAELVDPKRLK